MKLDTADYAFFPFTDESRDFFQEKYSFKDIFTDQALDVAVKRIKNSVLEDKKRDTTYSSELQFKSYICAKALLTEIDNPVYAYKFFESEAEYIVRQYSTEVLLSVLNINATTVNPIDPDILSQSELFSSVQGFTPELLSQYTKRFYQNIEPVDLLLQGDDSSSKFRGMFMKAKTEPTLYKIPVDSVVDTEEITLNNSRVYDSTVYVSESMLDTYIIEKLIHRLSEKYPNPVADVSIDDKKLLDIIQDKIDFCIAQLPKISYDSYETIQIESLSPELKSIYIRLKSDPSIVTEEEYEVLFHVLYRIGFTKADIIDLFSCETVIGTNYIEELLSDSNVSRTDEIETWKDIEEIVSSIQSSEDIYKSVTRNPVEYYRLRCYLSGE